MSDIINHEGKTLCMNCMSELDGKEACPNCGYPANERQRGDALPFHTRLQGRYIIGREKNRNGEGITYIGYDTVLNISVAVRDVYKRQKLIRVLLKARSKRLRARMWMCGFTKI